MPRSGWVKPVSDRRLSDLVSVGVLTRVFPPDLVDEVISAAGRTEQRNRSLPARRLVAIDGTCLDVADTPQNAAFFGRPGVMKGEKSAFPQARVVALAECGTHAMFDAVVGAYTSSEVALADELIGRLEPGMLLLADRGFYSFGLWRKAIGTGADLLWRVKTGLRPEHLRTLQ